MEYPRFIQGILAIEDLARYVDVDGDGRYLLQTIKEGKKGGPMVREMSTIHAHFRIAKLLMNYALKDTSHLVVVARQIASHTL